LIASCFTNWQKICVKFAERRAKLPAIINKINDDENKLSALLSPSINQEPLEQKAELIK